MTQALPAGMVEIGVRTPDQIRDDLLRDIRNAAVDAGRPVPDTSPGSFDFIRASGLANHLALLEANAMVVNSQQRATEAVGADLDARSAVNGLTRRPAAGSIGPIILNASAPSPVSSGSELTSPSGIRFRVTTGGLYQPGATIEVQAATAGVDTNLVEGTLLQWASAPPYSDAKAAVGVGGLVNGTADETDDELRARWIARLQNPPSESNPQAMCERAEQSTSAVQKAFCYPALLGPSTYALAVAASPTATNKSRQVAALTVTNVVAPITAGTHMDSMYPLIVSVFDEPVTDLSIALTIPNAKSSTIGGTGGGWVNGQPWPPAEAANAFCAKVVTPTVALPPFNSSRFAVQVTALPIEKVSVISWLSPIDWKLYTATVIKTEPDSAGVQVITLDRPFTGISAGCMIWPAAERGQAYVDAILKAFALMGPGEMSNSPPVLKRSARFPPPAQSWPSSLGGAQLRAMTDSGDEVLAASYHFATKATPAVDSTAPHILKPNNIGFYPPVS